MHYTRMKKAVTLLLSALLYTTTAFLSLPLQVLAAPDTEPDYAALAEERKSLPIQSNQVENWPSGPEIGAQAAILMEANTGVILYAKNIHERLYPASTTKLMTCLLAIENASLDEMVTFSHNAVFSLEEGSSNMGIDEREALTMEECLYGILVASANEVANAVAEHVGGSMDAFADMMNKKAAELGCTDTHFVNAHGLYHDEHYTSAYDLALIARAFFQNETLSKVGNTTTYHFVPTATQPDDFVKRNKHELITGAIPYEGIKGGKTGYTDEARQTLVTCAEKNGMKLICVILKEESPEQFNDTVKLFDYGFTNFVVTNVSEHETNYNVESAGFFHSSYNVFGVTSPLFSLNQSSYLILPKTIDFDELDSEVSYDITDSDDVAHINYSYHNTYVGTAAIELVSPQQSAYYSFDNDAVTPFTDAYESLEDTDSTDSAVKIIFINIKTVLFAILGITALLIIISIIRDLMVSYAFGNGRGSRKAKKRRSKKKDGPHL